MDIGSNCHCRLLHVSSKFRSSVAHMHTVSQSPKNKGTCTFKLPHTQSSGHTQKNSVLALLSIFIPVLFQSPSWSPAPGSPRASTNLCKWGYTVCGGPCTSRRNRWYAFYAPSGLQTQHRKLLCLPDSIPSVEHGRFLSDLNVFIFLSSTNCSAFKSWAVLPRRDWSEILLHFFCFLNRQP